MKPHSFGHPVPRTVVVGVRFTPGETPQVLDEVWYLMSTALDQLEVNLEGDWELDLINEDHARLTKDATSIDLYRRVVK